MDVAYALQKQLEYEADPTVWDQGVFRPMAQTLADLAAEARTTDFAAFIFAPDDIAEVRGERRNIVRDNVLFELGLFIGSLGADRCFIVTPRNAEPLHLPSDLLGVQTLTYAADRDDGRLRAALGPASHDILTAIRGTGMRMTGPVSVPVAPLSPDDKAWLTAKLIDDWNGPDLKPSRERWRAGLPNHAMEDEDGSATQAVGTIFSFLNTVAEALLAGRLDEDVARPVFEQPVHQVWRHAFHYLAPLNGQDEVWDPLPEIARLDRRWRRDDL